jgi:phosphopantetheine--protein transferase-like protein
MNILPPVGNDVVDLKHQENQGKSRDDRFLDRVFTAEERDRIAGAARPEMLLWALWAAKEASFKVVSRDDPTVRSTPRKFPISLDPSSMSDMCLNGRAITPRGELALRIVVTDDYVHALSAATVSDLDAVFQRVDRMDIEEDHRGASDFVRRGLLREIARCLDCPLGELSIGKEPLGPGAPFVLRRGQPLAIDISLSHDGRFAAFAFMIRKNP